MCVPTRDDGGCLGGGGGLTGVVDVVVTGAKVLRKNIVLVVGFGIAAERASFHASCRSYPHFVHLMI